MLLTVTLLLAQIGVPSRAPQSVGTGFGANQSQPEVQCDEYQHVEHHPGYVTGAPCSDGDCPAVAITVPAMPDTCEENTITIHEREWQDVQTRLKQLEEFTYCYSHACTAQ